MDEDYCFDCKKLIKEGDEEHEEHDRLRRVRNASRRGKWSIQAETWAG